MESLSPGDLARQLTSPRSSTDMRHCRNCLAMVMKLSVCPNTDLFPLIQPMINLLAHPDLLVKKTACQFFTKISDNQSESMMLAVNTLLKDTEDSNPMVRGLALRTMCALRHDAFKEHQITCLVLGLNDSSPYVKRSAVIACKTLSADSFSRLIESGLIDKLYILIRDPDPIVAVNCLLALDEILAMEGGIVLKKGMVAYLLGQLENFTLWGVAYILKLLLKYTPRSEDEIFDLMNILDPYLQHNSCVVTLCNLHLFLHLLRSLPDLHEEVLRRITQPLLHAISSGNPELSAMVLDWLIKNEKPAKNLFSTHCKMFYCRHRDPVYLKEKKLKFIVHLINEDNLKDILEEVTVNCHDYSPQVSLYAIQALGCIVLQFPKLSNSLLKEFKILLLSETDYILSNTLEVLVTLTNLPAMNSLVEQLCKSCYKLTQTNGLTAVLNLIGQFGGHTMDCVPVVDHFIEKYSVLDEEVQTQLVLTSLQLFSTNPAQYQFLLGELLDLCWNGSDKNMKDQVKFCISLLKSDFERIQILFKYINA